MIKPISLLLTSGFLLTACASLEPSRSFNRIDYPDLYAALDASPDGHEGIIQATGERFSIKSTHVNASRLCRLVEIQGDNTFLGESFCKAKGGEWR